MPKLAFVSDRSEMAAKKDGSRDLQLRGRYFGEIDPVAYAYAWLHHENTAPHHWGYWIPRSGQYKGQPLDMPETYVREMVADWLGASHTYTSSWDMTEWLDKNLSRIIVSDGTRQLVDRVLAEVTDG